MSINYFKFHIGDYLKDTRRLNAAEHGAYILLLLELYSEDGYVRYDLSEMRAICKCTARQWPNVWKKISRYFVVNGDKVTHKRVLEEVEKFKSRSDNSSRAAKARWDKNWSVNQHNDAGLRSKSGKAQTTDDVEKSHQNNALSMPMHETCNALHKPDTNNHISPFNFPLKESSDFGPNSESDADSDFGLASDVLDKDVFNDAFTRLRRKIDASVPKPRLKVFELRQAFGREVKRHDPEKIITAMAAFYGDMGEADKKYIPSPHKVLREQTYENYFTAQTSPPPSFMRELYRLRDMGEITQVELDQRVVDWQEGRL